MTLGQKLKELRSQKGLTQKELADKLHVSFQTVSKWENGENEPDIATLKELAALFECSVSELVSDVTESKTNGGTKKYRKVFNANCTIGSKTIDLYNGYIEGVKKVDSSFSIRCGQFDKKQLEKYGFSKIVNIQFDSFTHFFIDDKNKTFGFFYAFAPQFVCPFENLVSFSLSNSGYETGFKTTPAVGVGIGRNPSVAVGSVPQSVTNSPSNFFLVINYYDEDGKLCDYKIQITCARVYITHDGTVESVDDLYLWTNSLSRSTSTKMSEVISLLTAIKESNVGKNLPQISEEQYKKDSEESKVFVKKLHEDLEQLAESQRFMITAQGWRLIFIAVGVILIFGLLIFFIVFMLNSNK